MIASIKMARRKQAAKTSAKGTAAQLALALPPPKTHGGRRAGAGRKPTGTRRGALHRERVEITRH